MSRRKNVMEEHERMAMIDSLMYRREERGESLIQYTAPGAEQRWRARDLLDIHWNLTGIKCPESFNRVMSCIVGHVNVNTGACFPKQTTIGIETGCSRSTVRRAVEWWTANRFRKTEDRGLAHALAYHPQFKLFDMYYVAVTEDIAAQKEAANLEHACVTKGEHACITKGTHDVLQHADTHNLKEEISKRNLKEESKQELAHPPSASDAHVISSSEGKKEEGIQGEQVAKPSLPPEGPTSGEAQAIVSSYCQAHHWEHLTQENFDAAVAAEIVEPGAGRAVVDAAANEAARKAKEAVK